MNIWSRAWFRKTVGFLIGFFGSMAIGMELLSTRGTPWGLWLLIFIALGVLVSRLFANPKLLEDNSIDGLKNKWWSLQRDSRILAILSLAWALIATFAQQDEYRINYQIVLLPPIVVCLIYYAIKHLGAKK